MALPKRPHTNGDAFLTYKPCHQILFSFFPFFFFFSQYPSQLACTTTVLTTTTLLGITDLHNGMILFTLSISSHSFAFGFPNRPHTNGDVFLTYKLMIISSQQSSTHLTVLYLIAKVTHRMLNHRRKAIMTQTHSI